MILSSTRKSGNYDQIGLFPKAQGDKLYPLCVRFDVFGVFSFERLSIMSKAEQNKKQLLKMARNGQTRPSIFRFKTINRLRPDWFTK